MKERRTANPRVGIVGQFLPYFNHTTMSVGAQKDLAGAWAARFDSLLVGGLATARCLVTSSFQDNGVDPIPTTELMAWIVSSCWCDKYNNHWQVGFCDHLQVIESNLQKRFKKNEILFFSTSGFEIQAMYWLNSRRFRQFANTKTRH